MSTGAVGAADLETDRYVFNRYMDDHKPFYAVDPADVADSADLPVDTVRSLWTDWDDRMQQTVSDDRTEQIVDAFYMEPTVYAVAAHVDLHPATVFGVYQRNNIPDSRSTPYTSHDRSTLSNDDRITILEALNDGAAVDDLGDLIERPEEDFERLAARYVDERL